MAVLMNTILMKNYNNYIHSRIMAVSMNTIAINGCINEDDPSDLQHEGREVQNRETKRKRGRRRQWISSHMKILLHYYSVNRQRIKAKIKTSLCRENGEHGGGSRFRNENSYWFKVLWF